MARKMRATVKGGGGGGGGGGMWNLNGTQPTTRTFKSRYTLNDVTSKEVDGLRKIKESQRAS